jgi:hypothetical protein
VRLTEESVVKKAILNYAQMPEDALRSFRDGVSDLAIDVTGITSHQGEQPRIQRVFPNAKHYVWEAYRYRFGWTEPFDIELYETLLARHKAVVLPLVERYAPFEGGSIEAETRASQDFSRAQHILDQHQPDIVLFAKQPEAGLEYMLYLLARHYGIMTVMTRHGAFPHSRVVSLLLEDPILTKDWRASASIVPISDLAGAEQTFHWRTEEEIARIRNLGDKYLPDYMHDKIDEPRWIDALRAISTSSRTPKQVLGSVIRPAAGPIFKKTLYDRYARLATSDIDSRGGPTVFFPLHYQPELTTMPLGGVFVNQIKAIKLLSDALPEQGEIYVKEHPAVFAMTTKGNANFRPRNYYDWLLKIPHVSLIKPEVPSAYLQERAHVTAVVTGTAGLEAMLRGHAVLIFGNAAYRNGPGVYSVQETALSPFLDSCGQGGGHDREEAVSFLQALESVCSHMAQIPGPTLERMQATQRHYLDALLRGLRILEEAAQQESGLPDGVRGGGAPSAKDV